MSIPDVVLLDEINVKYRQAQSRKPSFNDHLRLSINSNPDLEFSKSLLEQA